MIQPIVPKTILNRKIIMTKFEHTSIVLHFEKKNFALTRKHVFQALAPEST